MALILIVDNDARTRLALSAILQADGHDIIEAAGGDTAEEADAARPADLILLDMHMPRRDGIETLRALRKRGCVASIVMMGGDCALCQGDFLPMAMRLGADATLNKPVDGEELRRAVSDLLTTQISAAEHRCRRHGAAAQCSHVQTAKL